MLPNHYSLKRMHSPSNEYDPNQLQNQQPLAKKILTQDMFHFTNQIAAMSLVNDSNNNYNMEYSNNDNTLSPKSSYLSNNKNVIRIDDINEYLADDEESNSYDDQDIYIGDPQIIEVNVNGNMLPMERINGASNLKVPNFIVHYNDPPDNVADRALYQMIHNQLEQQQQQMKMDLNLDQPMDID